MACSWDANVRPTNLTPENSTSGSIVGLDQRDLHVFTLPLELDEQQQASKFEKTEVPDQKISGRRQASEALRSVAIFRCYDKMARNLPSRRRLRGFALQAKFFRQAWTCLGSFFYLSKSKSFGQLVTFFARDNIALCSSTLLCPSTSAGEFRRCLEERESR